MAKSIAATKRSGESASAGNIRAEQNTKTEITNRLLDERQRLVEQLSKTFEPSGRGYWGKQLDADTKRKAAAEKRIADIDRKLKQESKQQKQTTEKKAAPVWQRAGDGWYIGKNGHEIRENYDTGGYDVVKVSGNSTRKVKHFAKLSEARKYNP